MLVLSIIGYKSVKVFKEDESIEISKLFGLINNIKVEHTSHQQNIS